jgi:undecaprenyl-diphosphatase
MPESLIALDKIIFSFINQGLSNQFFDWIMPVITDWDKAILGRLLIISTVTFLLWKGDPKKRMLVPLLFLTILITDQINSSVLKNMIARPRPCHVVDGAYIIENIRLLVSCGSGFSFPSSHAANSFAAATLLSIYYQKLSWLFILLAAIVGFSRIYVGVHFPLDVICGAVVGALCSLILYYSWLLISKYFSTQRTNNLAK